VALCGEPEDRMCGLSMLLYDR